MPRPRVTSRYAGVFWVAALALVVGFGWSRAQDGQPRYQGRTLTSWFGEYCRLHDDARRDLGDNARRTLAKMAIVEMGTNAFPYLLEKALDTRRSSPLHTNLHRIFLQFPDWAGRGAFVPREKVTHEAAFLLRVLRPPADLVRPRIESLGQSTNLAQLWSALLLAGTVGDGAETVVPFLVRHLTNTQTRWIPALAFQSIESLGPAASQALPVVIDQLDGSKATWLLIRWLGALGPAASPAVPKLEAGLASTNSRMQLQIAAALLNIVPGHPEALRIARERAAAIDTTADLRAQGYPTARNELCLALGQGPQRTNDHLAAILEPLAREEVRTWSSKGSAHIATHALEKVAPARALILYRAELDRAGAIPAAGRILALERTNEIAARILVEGIRQQPWWNSLPLFELAHASSSNRVAMDALESFAAGKFSQGLKGSAAERNQVLIEEAARNALARIRYREARAARGLPEDESW